MQIYIVVQEYTRVPFYTGSPAGSHRASCCSSRLQRETPRDHAIGTHPGHHGLKTLRTGSEPTTKPTARGKEVCMLSICGTRESRVRCRRVVGGRVLALRVAVGALTRNEASTEVDKEEGSKVRKGWYQRAYD